MEQVKAIEQVNKAIEQVKVIEQVEQVIEQVEQVKAIEQVNKVIEQKLIEQVEHVILPKVEVVDNTVPTKLHQYRSPQWCYNEYYYGSCRRNGSGCTFCHLTIPICPYGSACAKLTRPTKCDQYHFMSVCNNGVECKLYKIALKLFDDDLREVESTKDVQALTKNPYIMAWKQYWERTHPGENYGNNPLLHMINFRHRGCSFPGCTNYVSAFKNFKSCGKHET